MSPECGPEDAETFESSLKEGRFAFHAQHEMQRALLRSSAYLSGILQTVMGQCKRCRRLDGEWLGTELVPKVLCLDFSCSEPDLLAVGDRSFSGYPIPCCNFHELATVHHIVFQEFSMIPSHSTSTAVSQVIQFLVPIVIFSYFL